MKTLSMETLFNLTKLNNSLAIDTGHVRTFWIHGPSSAILDSYAEKIIKHHKFKLEDALTLNNYSWFKNSDESKRVLVFDGATPLWPDPGFFNLCHDRYGTDPSLPTKRGFIRNKFKLLIVKSLWAPSLIYQSLGQGPIMEALRRIHDTHLGNHVLRIDSFDDLTQTHDLISYRVYDETYKIPDLLIALWAGISYDQIWAKEQLTPKYRKLG